MMSNKDFDPYNFAKVSYDLGFEGLEYLAIMYKGGFYNSDNKFGLKEAKKMAQESKMRSDDLGLKNLLIMVDGEGNLANKDKNFNSMSVSNHKKWIDCASEMGCHSIRVNLDSDGTLDDWTNNSIESLNKLCEYAKPLNVNVIVENHGGYSSNAKWLVNVIQNTKRTNIGTLPDFGNFCIRSTPKDLSDWGATTSGCAEEYDRYLGVEELLPYAMSVSAKSNDFDSEGNCIETDFSKMVNIIKKSDYRGYVSIEYEGSNYSEEEGIRLTKTLLEREAI